jgi:hypothetical protein
MIIDERKKGPVCRWGFTLAEAMMAVVVLGIASAGVLLPFSSGAMIQAEGIHWTLGAELASDLMEQVINTPFAQIVVKYGNYSEPAGQVKDATGVVFTDAGYARFSRSACCQYVYLAQEQGTTAAVFIRATVSVSYNGKSTAIIERLISK